MNVIVTARHCDLSDDMREAIDRQFENLLRFEPRASRAEVTLTGRKNGFDAEALVSVDGARGVHGRADAADLKAAVDGLAQKLAVQLRRRREKRRDHQAPPMDELFGDPSRLPDDGESAPE